MRTGWPPSPGPPRLKKTTVRSTLPDFWGPLDPIGVLISDSPKGERARNNTLIPPVSTNRRWAIPIPKL